MLLTGFNHDEIPDMIDAIKLSLRFVEWRTVEPEYGDLPPEPLKSQRSHQR